MLYSQRSIDEKSRCESKGQGEGAGMHRHTHTLVGTRRSKNRKFVYGNYARFYFE